MSNLPDQADEIRNLSEEAFLLCESLPSLHDQERVEVTRQICFLLRKARILSSRIAVPGPEFHQLSRQIEFTLHPFITPSLLYPDALIEILSEIAISPNYIFHFLLRDFYPKLPTPALKKSFIEYIFDGPYRLALHDADVDFTDDGLVGRLRTVLHDIHTLFSPADAVDLMDRIFRLTDEKIEAGSFKKLLIANIYFLHESQEEALGEAHKAVQAVILNYLEPLPDRMKEKASHSPSAMVKKVIELFFEIRAPEAALRSMLTRYASAMTPTEMLSAIQENKDRAFSADEVNTHVLNGLFAKIDKTSAAITTFAAAEKAPLFPAKSQGRIALATQYASAVIYLSLMDAPYPHLSHIQVPEDYPKEDADQILYGLTRQLSTERAQGLFNDESAKKMAPLVLTLYKNADNQDAYKRLRKIPLLHEMVRHSGKYKQYAIHDDFSI